MKRFTRREFLFTLTAGSGILSAALYWRHRATAQAGFTVGGGDPVELPGAFVTLNGEAVVMRCNRPEMGQGTMTSMSMLLAEELEVAWESVKVEWAPVRPPFTDPHFYGVEWSSAVRDMHLPLRQLGAGLRELLVAAAARRWNVPANDCFARDGGVHRKDGAGSLAYGALTDDLAGATLPVSPVLKSDHEFRILNRRIPNVLNRSVVTGEARYGLDTRIQGALTAVVVRPANRMATLGSMDLSAAQSVAGFIAAETLPQGVAVIGRDYWSAERARRAIKVEWNLGRAAGLNSAGISAQLIAALEGPPTFTPVDHLSDEVAGAAPRIFTYQVPYQAHAALEPTSAVANVTSGRCDIWMANQNMTHIARQVSKALGLPREAVAVHPALMGGSFGRKYEPDPAIEAALLSQRTGKTIRVVWSREDEMRNGPHRPVQVGRFAVTLGADGLPRAVDARYAGPSYFIKTAGDLDRIRTKQGGYDGSTFEGLVPFPYPIPFMRVSQYWVDPGISVGSWRSTAHSFNTFFIESLVDELAHSAKEDPLDYRTRWLNSESGLPKEKLPESAFAPPFNRSRMVRLIDALREAASASSRHGSVIGRGFAVQFAYEGYSGAMLEIRARDGRPSISGARLIADIGLVVNRSGAEQQLIGGFLFGLTAALKSGLTIKGGSVEQTNFHQFELLRLNETPPIEVHLIDSPEPPAGLGETGVALAAPALANALFAATGRRPRSLPVRLDQPEWSIITATGAAT